MIKRKINEWLKRYLPAEIVGTITAITAATITRAFSNNHIFIAYAGALGDGAGFYSTIFIQNILLIKKKRNIERRKFSFKDFYKIIASIILEFGPSGLIDGLLLRPFFMYLFPLLLKNFTLGILVGKIGADITFYFLVILSYETKKRNVKSKL